MFGTYQDPCSRFSATYSYIEPVAIVQAMAIARATDIFMCVLLYNVLLLSSSLEAYAQLRSCSPGTFCPIGANCTSNTNLCVDFCPTKNDLMQQGNHLTGNCERGNFYARDAADLIYYS